MSTWLSYLFQETLPREDKTTSRSTTSLFASGNHCKSVYMRQQSPLSNHGLFIKTHFKTLTSLCPPTLKCYFTNLPNLNLSPLWNTCHNTLEPRPPKFYVIFLWFLPLDSAKILFSLTAVTSNELSFVLLTVWLYFGVQDSLLFLLSWL